MTELPKVGDRVVIRYNQPEGVVKERDDMPGYYAVFDDRGKPVYFLGDLKSPVYGLEVLGDD